MTSCLVIGLRSAQKETGYGDQHGRQIFGELVTRKLSCCDSSGSILICDIRPVFPKFGVKNENFCYFFY